MAYLINVVDTNRYGGPFSHLWEVQQYIDKKGYDADQWEFTSDDTEYRSYSDLKSKIDNGEINVPCGERNFNEDHTETYITYDEQLESFEVDVVAECTECGFKHDVQTHVEPTPL